MLIPIAIWIVTVTLSILFIHGATKKKTPKAAPASTGSDHVTTKAERMDIAKMELDRLILQLTFNPTDEQLAAKAQLSAKWVN